MKEIIGLKREYVSVSLGSNQKSYGGNQAYFDFGNEQKNRKYISSGCGIVAMMDVFCYMTHRTYFTSKSDYNKNLINFANTVHWRPHKYGTLSLSLPIMLGTLLKKRKLSRFAFWGLSIRKFDSRIKKMLHQDIPVIVCIPFVFLKKKSKNNFPFYSENNGQMSLTHRVSGHFVTITGVCEINHKQYYRISSWGQCLYMDSDEYLRHIRRLPLGFYMGNLFCIK